MNSKFKKCKVCSCSDVRQRWRPSKFNYSGFGMQKSISPQRQCDAIPFHQIYFYPHRRGVERKWRLTSGCGVSEHTHATHAYATIITDHNGAVPDLPSSSHRQGDSRNIFPFSRLSEEGKKQRNRNRFHFAEGDRQRRRCHFEQIIQNSLSEQSQSCISSQ